MKFIVYFYLFLFYFKNDIEATKIENHVSSTTKQKIPSEVNYFENLTIQDVLDLGIDDNNKIERKLFQAITEFTSNSEAYSPIQLMRNASFPRKTIKIDLDSGYKAVLENLIIQHSNDGPEKRRQATNVDCDLFGNTTISIILSRDLRIVAPLKVNQASKKSPIEGEIEVTLKGTKLYKTLATTNTPDGSSLGEDVSEIEYENSVMNVKVDKRVQKLIYSKWDKIMHELENSIKETFEQELNTQISTHTSNSLVSFCSNKINTERGKKTAKKVFTNRPSFYVISDKTSKTWRQAILAAGPIIIHGLSNFQNLELRVSENERSSNNDDIMKDLTANLETGELEGKFEWSYMLENTQSRTFANSFSVDFLQLENTVGYITRRVCYQNSLKVYLGEIKINDSENLCENENLLLNSFLSEYLSTIIKTQLENTIVSKINFNPSFSSCPPVS